MEQQQDLVDHPGGGGARLGLGCLVRPGEDRLDEFEIPVAEHVPDELVERRRRLVELVFVECRAHARLGARRLAGDPAVDGDARGERIVIRVMRHAVHLGKARGVPQLGAEVAVALDARLGELDVAALRGHGGQREAQRIRAIVVDQFQRVDDVALGLRHLLALLVADQGVDVDGVERHFLHEVQPHHHHAGDPEEDDVEAGDEHIRLVMALQLRRLLRPAQRRERPERGGEPGVEHVLVARQASRACRNGARPRAAPGSPSPRRRPCHPAHTRPGSGGPTRAGARCTRAGCCASIRNRSSPSSSARRPVSPFSTAAMAGLASSAAFTYHCSVSHGSITTSERSPCGTWLVCGSILSSKPQRLEHLDDALARLEAVEAVQRHGLRRNLGSLRGTRHCPRAAPCRTDPAR